MAIWDTDIAAAAEIDVVVIAAWKSPTGQIATDNATPVATLVITGTSNNQQLKRVNFSTLLPCPGLLVYIVANRGANAGNIRAEISIGLELLAS